MSKELEEDLRWEKIGGRVSAVFAVIVVIHILFLVVLAIMGKWHAFFGPTPALGSLIWIVCNDFFGCFAVVFATKFFSGKRLIFKILGYPMGVLTMFCILFTLSFPFGLLGILLAPLAMVPQYRPARRNF